MNDKIDPRVKRTKKLLCDAMLDLLVETIEAGGDFESITIQAITDRAEVNRVTFYLHYTSKTELLGEAIENRLNDLIQIFETASEPINLMTQPEGYQHIFEHIGHDAPLYKVLLGEKGMAYVSHRITEYMTYYAYRQMSDALVIQASHIPLEIVIRASASSVVSLVAWWVQADMPYTPEQMAQFCFQFCCQGFYSFLTPESKACLVNDVGC